MRQFLQVTPKENMELAMAMPSSIIDKKNTIYLVHLD